MQYVSKMLSIVIFLGLTQLSNAAAKKGKITKNETWKGKISISGNVNINNATLTVEPGTEVSFTQAHKFNIGNGGLLLVKGTAKKPVIFKSKVAKTMIGIREGRAHFAFARLDNVGIGGKTTKGAGPMLKIEDSMVFNAKISAYGKPVEYRRNIVTNPEGKFCLVCTWPGSIVEDNVLYGGTWVTKSLGGDNKKTMC